MRGNRNPQNSRTEENLVFVGGGDWFVVFFRVTKLLHSTKEESMNDKILSKTEVQCHQPRPEMVQLGIKAVENSMPRNSDNLPIILKEEVSFQFITSLLSSFYIIKCVHNNV